MRLKNCDFFRYHQGMPPTVPRTVHARPPHPPSAGLARPHPRRAGRAGGRRRQPAEPHRERQARAQALAAAGDRDARPASRSPTCCRPSRPTGARRSRSSSSARSRARSSASSASPPVRVTKGMPRRHDRVDPRPAPRAAAPRARGDRHARRGAPREHRAAPADARRATTTCREIEKLAEKQLKAAGHVSGALTHRTVSIMAEQLGFELLYVNDLPHSARSVTDLEHGRIYLPPASIPGGHGLRSMALQAMAHRLLGHQRPTDYADFLAAAPRDQLLRRVRASCPRRRRSPSSRRRRATATSPSRTSATRSASRTKRPAMRMTNLLTQHLGIRAALPPGRRLRRDLARVRERRPAAAPRT